MNLDQIKQFTSTAKDTLWNCRKISQLLLLLQPFYDPLSGTTRVSRYQKDKPFWILLKQRWWGGSGISLTICKLLALHSRRQPCQHLITQIFTGQMLFLTPNQQHQSTEGRKISQMHKINCNCNQKLGHLHLSLIHIWRCRRIERCRSRWSPYH